MTVYEIGDIVASVAALILSIIALVIAYRAGRNTEKQSRVAALNNIFVNIDGARARMEDQTAQMAALSSNANRTEQEERQLEILNSILDSKIEGLLIAYDDACQRFLNGDVDEEPFRAKYIHSVKELVERYPEKFREPVTRFKNLSGVYRRWYA